jgi:hypothetical protein
MVDETSGAYVLGQLLGTAVLIGLIIGFIVVMSRRSRESARKAGVLVQQQVPTYIAPGWHPDPAQPGTLRWWDGVRWTEHVQPAPGSAPAPAAGAPSAFQPFE